MEDRELSRAVIAHLGSGRPSPPQDSAGPDDADSAALSARVRAIVADFWSIEIDWSTHSLVEGGREAERIMAARHPELGGDALEALFQRFTYEWR
ncbi:hypothetical protein AB0I28_13895 [Phytomonospora sp. NPDC050363]|uniref:hypothetical protein n=1 Tax=Phytomonospora sp. NPDC050363 TaxID=3155642 RepID=UPI0033F98064